jgi:hypothetical protein
MMIWHEETAMIHDEILHVEVTIAEDDQSVDVLMIVTRLAHALLNPTIQKTAHRMTKLAVRTEKNAVANVLSAKLLDVQLKMKIRKEFRGAGQNHPRLGRSRRLEDAVRLMIAPQKAPRLVGRHGLEI